MYKEHCFHPDLMYIWSIALEYVVPSEAEFLSLMVRKGLNLLDLIDSMVKQYFWQRVLILPFLESAVSFYWSQSLKFGQCPIQGKKAQKRKELFTS